MVIEAEHAHAQLGSDTAGGHHWRFTTAFDSSGDGMMEAWPDQGSYNFYTNSANRPRLDYVVQFTQAGTHYIWLRGAGTSDNSDDVHVGLNDQVPASAESIQRLRRSPDWTRETRYAGPVASLEVPAPGVHTLRIYMREDGALVDKILLTTNPNYVPTGKGPAESLRQSQQ